ncbi:esterase/lipase family protein [Streptomyces sp. NPDC085596]|uniref:esterase/lipase family protein n=1 Tax=Streptomyces sp. NPDC085596 TaxID=3365731 RepID=UPI0037D3BD4C
MTVSDQQNEKAEQSVGEFTLAGPLSTTPPTALPYPVPEPDATWDLPHGFAHVYYGAGNQGIVRPVLMADGFNLGKSDLDWLYAGLDRDFPLLSELRRRGRDVILVGFKERSASILDNARTVTAAVQRTIAEQLGDALLTVGGFSMGGLITRYALAKMEQEHIDHRTSLYFSYDTPHRGAYIPVGLQAFSHFIPLPNAFARQMNSPAARQMLWRHYDPMTGESGIAPERTEFLQDLESVGGWPRIPRTLALANGRGDGTGLAVPPGETVLKTERIYPGTAFYAQAQGREVTVAELKRRFPKAEKTVTTSGFPELDGAPGGTLRSYGILADALKKAGAQVDLRHEEICFVPSVSAVAVRDLDEQKDLYTAVDSLSPEDSDVDDFVCSATTTAHTAVTEELGTWLIDRLTD